MSDKKDNFENEQDAYLIDHESQLEAQEEFGSFSKEEMIKFLDNFDWKDSIAKSSTILANIKSAYDQQLQVETDEALQRFIDEGGIENDFEYKKSPIDNKFDKSYQRIKSDLARFFAELENKKQENLKIKSALLERLRKLISAEESNLSLNEFKAIQEEWKQTGHVPIQDSQELWNNYKALVDIFYNNRTIFFELKELDRKKNLEAKIEVCEKVEKLTELTSINQALKELKALHEDFKLIGPVPKEEQESLWTRLKEASDKIYEKRKEYLIGQKQLQEQNLILKKDLLAKLEPYSEFSSSRIDDWKAKTLEVQDLQTQWKKSGAIPESAKDVNTLFWDKCKVFYKNKNDFFKELDKKRIENLNKRVSICEQMESLSKAENLEQAIQEVKNTQRNWIKLGQVPIKHKEKINKRFKDACDAVFARKHALIAEEEKAFVGNLEQKKSILEEIKTFIASSEPKTIQALTAFQKRWDAIGYVPKADKNSIAEAYNAAVNSFINQSIEIAVADKENFKLKAEIIALKSSDAGREQLKKKEFGLKKRLSTIKSEIIQYQTNMEFFGKSKNADKLKEEIQSKIDILEKELKSIENELKILKS